MPAKIQIAIVDDHQLFRKGLIGLLQLQGDRYELLLEAENGEDLLLQMAQGKIPDVILMDINMPGMNGFACMKLLNESYTDCKVVIISMVEREEVIMQMLRMGVKGYLTKNVNPAELLQAIEQVIQKGYYYTDFITGKVIHSIQNDDPLNSLQKQLHPALNDREQEFLQLACSELTYQQIADKMFLSPKTIDGYRMALFEKLDVKSRTGLVLFAVKNGLVTP